MSTTTASDLKPIPWKLHLSVLAVEIGERNTRLPERLERAADFVHDRFDAAGELTHAPTRELIGKLLAALAAWTQRLTPA